MSEGIPNIITACHRTGVKRIVLQSGINLSDRGELSYVSSLAVRLMRRIFGRPFRIKVLRNKRSSKVSSIGSSFVHPCFSMRKGT